MTKKGKRLPHNRAAAIFHEDEGVLALSLSLAYTFNDPGLLKRALIHPSLSGQKNNQRLEFLGDAVLEICVSQTLFNLSKETEGELTRKRQRLVCEEQLARVAGEINLGRFLMMDESLKKSGGDKLDSILADAMEAVLAAVFLDGGMAAACGVVNRLWAEAFAHSDAALDPKGALQAWLTAKGLPFPAYQVILAEGPPHQQRFTVAVLSSGAELARGEGATKKAAERQAAEIALSMLAGEAKADEAHQA